MGQAFLVYLSWKAFSVYIMASMSGPDHAYPVSYDVFWAFFMSREIGFTGIIDIIRDFVHGKSLKSKAHRVLIVLILLFVMVWPTVASAMTGYDTNKSAFIKTIDGVLVPFSHFTPVLYVIHDGERVGLRNGHIVPYCSSPYSGIVPTVGSPWSR